MKTTETRNLVGLALDYYVAMSQGHVWRYPWKVAEEGLVAMQQAEVAFGNPIPDYSTDWAAGGPVIEREHIKIAPWHPDPRSQASFYDSARNSNIAFVGETMLIAAMRAVVAKHYGEHVPELKP